MIGSATATRPAGRSSTATRTAVCPPGGARPPAREVSGRDPERLQEPRVPERDAAAPTRPAHPLLPAGAEVRGLLEREPALAARAPRSRSARGCSLRLLEACREPEELGLVVRRKRDQRGQPGPALGQGPGLVDDERVDLSAPSDLERLACLTRTPAVAPRPVPTMIDIGVASPSAHGHAMIRTATRRDQRVGQTRLGPDGSPDEGAQERHGHHGRHEIGGHAVCQALDRRAAPLRLADQLDDPREQRVPADALGPHHEGARPVDGAAGHPILGRLLDGHRLSGDHRLVDDAPSLENDAVDRDPLARPHAQPVARRRTLVERHVLLALVVPEDARGRRRERSAARGARRSSGPARGAPAPGPAAREP